MELLPHSAFIGLEGFYKLNLLKYCMTITALQAATISVTMATEKNFGDQNSEESRQLATNRLKEKLI